MAIDIETNLPGADLQAETQHEGARTWYGQMTRSQRNAFWSCKLGYILDAMDTQFLSFVIPTLIAAWGITRGDAGLIGTVTLLTSAVGGWLAGVMSDRIGRVRTLQITIVWFAFFTLLCAFAQNFGQLLWARGLMGLGFGGEWTAGAVLIGEVIRAKDRGKAVGIVQAGWAIGWGLSTLLFTLVFSLVPPEYAWRVLFAIGIAPAPFVIWIRRFVEEPEVHQRQQAAQAAGDAERASFLDIFRGDIAWTTIRASVLATGVQGGYYAITTWLPTYLKTERGLSVIGTGAYLGVVIVGSYCGYLAGAWLSDRLGRRRAFMLFAVASVIIATVYTQLALDNVLMLALGFPLGFCASGIFSGMGAFLTELYPTRIRGSGQGFCYNFGRAVGATFPFLIGHVSQGMSLGHAIGLFAAAAYGVVILAALTLPETQGRALTE
ncbi:putative MFS family arabinose efflux permease [Cupriavidus plantarum]|nr:putative MFS family arabinose efflux permease [Cupriavidus plantarum]RLK28547.1 putative MFS family arabinose efflux permease [Cupriavidus plantarum]